MGPLVVGDCGPQMNQGRSAVIDGLALCPGTSTRAFHQIRQARDVGAVHRRIAVVERGELLSGSGAGRQSGDYGQ
jgi:hypothetical protein